MKGKFFLKTFGCQMNLNDSERIRGILKELGFSETQDWKEADLILLNTCTVREKPDQKVLSHLGEYRKNERAVIGVCGCLAQRMGEELLKRAPFVKLMFSSYNIHHLPELINRAFAGYRAVEILNEPPEDENELWNYKTVRDNRFCAYVTVIKGCDKFCTYCVVPYTRGRERSRPLESILEEVKYLVDDGVKEIHLLGQNVTAWGKDLGSKYRFSDLLYEVSKVEGVERIRFTTGHPKDITEDVIEAMATLPKICNALHLPFQAGSNRILKLMKREYTKEEYLEKVSLLKERVKGIALSTDVIVGFPTETEEDFEETLEVLREVEFEQVFSFKFSPRPGTPAYSMEGQVPEEVKRSRMARLLELQKSIYSKLSKKYEGQVVEVLVEERKGEEYVGRTTTNKWVSLKSSKDLLGKTVKVKVKKASPFSLEGELI